MYTYNIFAYLYFKSTKFYLSFYLSHPYARSLSYGFNFPYLVFYFLVFSPQSFYAADTRIYAFHATVFIVGLVSFRILLSFFFFSFYYPLLFDISLSV